MSFAMVRGVALIALLLLHLTLAIDAAKRHGSQRAAKVKRESDPVGEAMQADGDEEGEPTDGVIYDQRQVNGETNIRLRIKNLQLQLPESQLAMFQKSDMAQLIRNSVLRLFGIEMPVIREQEETKPPIGQPQPEQNPSVAQQPLPETTEPPLPDISAAMLQVNGNNLPAKFFLEISDFLMNINDNDAVDDKRVETNHNQQQQLEQQHLQQQQQQQSSQQSSEPLYATEEIKIERLENMSNVKNQTITISKRRHQVAPRPLDRSDVLEETVNTENHRRSNSTHNATESTDRFVQTKPIRLETVMVRVETDVPKTLREKVIWRMPVSDENDSSQAQHSAN